MDKVRKEGKWRKNKVMQIHRDRPPMWRHEREECIIVIRLKCCQCRTAVQLMLMQTQLIVCLRGHDAHTV